MKKRPGDVALLIPEKYLFLYFYRPSYRVEQLHLLKLKAFLNFESSTHSVVVKWPVEFGFIVGSRYVQVYPLANQIHVHTCKKFSFVECLQSALKMFGVCT